MSLISILHPSRSRITQSFRTFRKWIEKASVNKGTAIQFIPSVDVDDPTLQDYIAQYGNFGVNVIVGNNRSAVDAINNAAKVAEGNILIVVSDDTDCPDNWADKIIEATQDKTDWIAKTLDGIQKWIITMPVMDRAYYNRFGYIYHPDYLHMFCDTELTCVADLTERKIEINVPFIHNHYSTGKSVRDAVSDKADKTWSQGEKVFVERYKRNFDLIDPPGKIKSVEYLNWIKGKL